MHERQPAVYIMANQRRGTLYTGVTSDLIVGEEIPTNKKVC
jgi:predicted GIY-YIG superfamily endonuclease